MTQVMKKPPVKIMDNWEEQNDSAVSSPHNGRYRYGRQFLLKCYPVSANYINNEKENNHLFNQMIVKGENIKHYHSVIFTKKMVRPKNKEDLIDWMKENAPPCLHNDTSHNGVVYDRWSKNKQKRMQQGIIDDAYFSSSTNGSYVCNTSFVKTDSMGSLPCTADSVDPENGLDSRRKSGKPLLDNEFAIPNIPDNNNSRSIEESLDGDKILSNTDTIIALDYLPFDTFETNKKLLNTFMHQEKIMYPNAHKYDEDEYDSNYCNNQFGNYCNEDSKFKRWKFRKNSPVKKFVPRNITNKQTSKIDAKQYNFNPAVKPFMPKKKSESIPIISPKTGLPLKPFTLNAKNITKQEPEFKTTTYKKPILSEPPLLNGEVRYDEGYLENKENSSLKIEFYNSKGKHGAVLSGHYEKPFVNGARKFKKQTVYKENVKDKRFKRKPFGERNY